MNTGRFREAANLALAARTGTTGLATATLTAHFHTMEARALARLGEAKPCDLALAAAPRRWLSTPVHSTMAGRPGSHASRELRHVA
jgi:hypothetical protein